MASRHVSFAPPRDGAKDEDAFAALAHIPNMCFCQNEASGTKGLHESVLSKRVDPSGTGATYGFLESTYRSWPRMRTSI